MRLLSVLFVTILVHAALTLAWLPGKHSVLLQSRSTTAKRGKSSRLLATGKSCSGDSQCSSGSCSPLYSTCVKPVANNGRCSSNSGCQSKYCDLGRGRCCNAPKNSHPSHPSSGSPLHHHPKPPPPFPHPTVSHPHP